MKPWVDWLSAKAFGKKLRRLHAWNAWLVLMLAASGVILFLPLRQLGAGRVMMRYAHVYLGLISLLIIVLYLPLIVKHWRQLRKRPGQRINLIVVLGILTGWIVSGVLLWQFRLLPDRWSGTALFFHDLFTWVGVPYAVYHSISRSRWVKKSQVMVRQPSITHSAAADTAVPPAANPEEMDDTAAGLANVLVDHPAKSGIFDNLPISRRSFIRFSLGALLALGVGPAFYRWVKTTFDSGGEQVQQLAASAKNEGMLPVPKPLPQSSPPAGGGAEGNFRIYTVTDMPSFTADNWSFSIKGLVDKPQTWNWQQFLKLKRSVQVSDFHCVTGWSVYHLTWEGIPLSQLLNLAGVQAEAKYIKFYSGDKVYTDTLTLEQARMKDVMVAVLMDGQPIPNKLGGPVRLIVPEMYAYKSVKWLETIELIPQNEIGFWELRGYDTDAWVNKT